MSTTKISSQIKNDLLQYALELADLARNILCQHFSSLERTSATAHSYKIESKSDTSPVTDVDKEIEKTLRAHIQRKFPTHAILGEEFGRQEGASGSDFLWVIDPLDGTKSFITGNPLFGTLIALLCQEEILLGVMELPILQQRWWAQKNAPTFFSTAAITERVQARHTAKLNSAWGRCTTPDMFTVNYAAAFNQLKRKLKYMLYGGDCFSYAQLVSGYVDMVIENDLAAHDFLALVPIIEGAGAVISDWQGQPLHLRSQGDVLASANAMLHTQALQALQLG